MTVGCHHDSESVDSWPSQLLTPQSQGTAATACRNSTMSNTSVVNRNTSLELNSVICTVIEPEEEIQVFVTVPSSVDRPAPSGGGCILFE